MEFEKVLENRKTVREYTNKKNTFKYGRRTFECGDTCTRRNAQ